MLTTTEKAQLRLGGSLFESRQPAITMWHPRII
jgi:hypothetical protein